MIPNMKVLALGFASLAALVYPTAAAPSVALPIQKLQARSDAVCQGHSKLAFPTPGQVLPANKPFDIVYCSGAYFKINTISVEAFYSSGDNATSGIFADLLGNLQTTSDSETKYGQFSFTSKASVPDGFKTEKNGFVFVLEKTTQYTTSGTSVNIFKVPVQVAAF